MRLAELLFLVCLAGAVAAAPQVQVRLQGAFAHPGLHSLPQGSRLSKALEKGGLSSQACQMQAAWLRKELLKRQTQLKRSLLYDLQALSYAAQLQNRPRLARWAGMLGRLIQSQPVTGRKAGHPLVWGKLEVQQAFDLPLKEGDQLIYPACDTRYYYLTEQGVKAFDHDPAKTLEADANVVEALPWQAPGWIWVVHADGNSEKRRIGYWYGGSPRHLDPGAVLFRPLSKDWTEALGNPDFNRDLARWLATQIPNGGVAEP